MKRNDLKKRLWAVRDAMDREKHGLISKDATQGMSPDEKQVTVTARRKKCFEKG